MEDIVSKANVVASQDIEDCSVKKKSVLIIARNIIIYYHY
jgi:hypothetical protein